MYWRIVSFYVVITFLCMGMSYSARAADPKPGSVKMQQEASREAPDVGTKTGQGNNDIQNYPGFLYKPLEKDATHRKAGYIRLKQRPVNNGEAKEQIVYDIEFSDSQPARKKAENGADDKPYVSIEKIENIDKSSFMKKETAKEHKAEVSLGYKLSSFSEIYLGKGFLVERKDNSALQTHDDGWRIRFKTNF